MEYAKPVKYYENLGLDSNLVPNRRRGGDNPLHPLAFTDNFFQGLWDPGTVERDVG